MGQFVKTTISLKKDLFVKATELAKDLQIPRSRVIVSALEEFIKKKESEILLTRLNAAYSEDDQQEVKLKKAMGKKHRTSIEKESW